MRWSRAIAALAMSLMLGHGVVRAQVALDIDTVDILADTVSIFASATYPMPAVALPECACPDSNFFRNKLRSEQMDCLVSKLDSVVLFGSGRVNMLHIGGSHVQADIYTHVFRQNIDSLNGTLMPPRGLIFPYSIAKTNNPSNYRVRHGGQWTGARNSLRQFALPQGACGILAYTTDTAAWFSVDLNPDSLVRWTATRIHVIGSSCQKRSHPVLTADNMLTVEGVEEPTGFCFSLPDAVSRFRIDVCFDSVQTVSPDTFVVSGLYVDNDEPGIVYSSIGVNGASVPSYIGCVNMERDLSLVRPDVVIFAVGINDAVAHNFSDSVFVANYDCLIRTIRRASPNCAFIFITNNDSFRRIRRNRYTPNANGDVARRGFYQLASKWNAPVWDLYEVMGGLGSMQKWQAEHLAQKDKVHFTRDGYSVVGQLFFDAFLDYYLNYDI